MARSYSESEWMGLKPVYSPAIRDERAAFDWDAYERERQKQDALEWVEYQNTRIFPTLSCAICGEWAGKLIAYTTDENLEDNIAHAMKNARCRDHGA